MLQCTPCVALHDSPTSPGLLTKEDGDLQLGSRCRGGGNSILSALHVSQSQPASTGQQEVWASHRAGPGVMAVQVQPPNPWASDKEGK